MFDKSTLHADSPIELHVYLRSAPGDGEGERGGGGGHCNAAGSYSQPRVVCVVWVSVCLPLQVDCSSPCHPLQVASAVLPGGEEIEDSSCLVLSILSLCVCLPLCLSLSLSFPLPPPCPSLSQEYNKWCVVGESFTLDPGVVRTFSFSFPVIQTSVGDRLEVR